MSDPAQRTRRRGAVVVATLATSMAFVSGATGGPAALPQQSGLVDLLTQANVRLDGADAFGYSAEAVAAAGDVNGDGIGDVVVGAPEANSNGLGDSGYAYVVFGRRTTGTVDLADARAGGFRIDGELTGDELGTSVAGIGDINGDGRDDVLVGAPNASNGSARSGAAYLIFGKATSTTVNVGRLGSAGFRIGGAAPGDDTGRSVAGLGDVNGDRRPDLLIGAPNASGNRRQRSGSAYVVFGTPSSENVDLGNGLGGFRIDGEAADDSAGFAVAGAGDVNGDGRPDMIVGARGADPRGREGAGAAYVVLGKSAPTAVDLARLGTSGFRIDGPEAFEFVAESVAGAGDVNGDGLGDVLVGAFRASNNGRPSSGSAHVVFGTRSTTPIDLAALDAAGFRIDGVAAGDQAGFSVAGAGDVNGDGRRDVLVGARAASGNGREEAGAAYVVFGSTAPSNVDLARLGRAGIRIDGAAANDRAGFAVAGAGDMNGDGRPDVLVGATAADARDRIDAGAAYVVFGFGRPQLAYRPLRAKVGSAIAPHSPTRLTRTGTPRFQVAPTLPAGLRIDALGVIRGTPTAAQRQTTHRVTMTDLTGSATASLEITVAAPDDERPPPTAPPPDPEEGGDTTAPALVLRAPSPQRVARQGSVRLSASCNEPCRLQASGRIRVGRSSIRLVPAKASLGAAGTKALRLRVTPAGKKRLQAALRRGLRAQAAITVRAADAAGNASTRSRVVRVR